MSLKLRGRKNKRNHTKNGGPSLGAMLEFYNMEIDPLLLIYNSLYKQCDFFRVKYDDAGSLFFLAMPFQMRLTVLWKRRESINVCWFLGRVEQERQVNKLVWTGAGACVIHVSQWNTNIFGRVHLNLMSGLNWVTS